MRVLCTLGLAAALGFVSAPRVAAADEPGSLSQGLYLLSNSVAVGVPGIVFCLGNLAALGHDRPSLGWIIPGYIVGGLNVLLGAVIAAYGGLGLGNRVVGWGVGHIALGGLDITLASLGVAKRRRARYEAAWLERYSLGPLRVHEGAGLVLGLGVRRAIW